MLMRWHTKCQFSLLCLSAGKVPCCPCFVARHVVAFLWLSGQQAAENYLDPYNFIETRLTEWC